MKKILLIITLSFISLQVNAQYYRLRYDSVGIVSKLILNTVGTGSSTDSVLVKKANGGVYKVARSSFGATGEKALTGSETFTSSTGFGSANTYNLDTVLSDTLYSVYVQVKTSATTSGSFVLPIKISRTTSTFTVNMQSGSGSPSGTLNWLVLPTGWNGIGGGGGGGGYTLPIASASVLGGIKVGTGLNIDGGGVLSTTGGASPDTTIYRTAANSFTKAQSQPRITLTTTGGSGAATFNAATGALNIPIYTGGGGGSVTQVTSANGDITVANTTSTPVLTLNSGYSSGQVAKRISNGIAWDSGIDASITNDPTTKYWTINSGTTSFGGLIYKNNSNQTRLQIETNGDVKLPQYASGSTAPTTSGTKHMVTVDANGLLSHETIPGGGGGGVTSISAGTGMSFSTITSTGAVNADTTVLRTVANSLTKAQTQTALNLKQNSLSGTGFVKISGTTISYDNSSYMPLSGGTFTGAVSGTTFTASGGFFDTSDMRLKNKVKTKFDASKINSFSYQFKDKKDNKTHVGYSAQQVRLYMPDAVKKDDKGNLSVNYIEVLVQKVSQLEAKIKNLEAKK